MTLAFCHLILVLPFCLSVGFPVTVLYFSTWLIHTVSHRVLFLGCPFQNPPHTLTLYSLFWDTALCHSVPWASQVHLPPLSFVPFLCSVRFSCRAIEKLILFCPLVCFHVSLPCLEHRTELLFSLHFELLRGQCLWFLRQQWMFIILLIDWMTK